MADKKQEQGLFDPEFCEHQCPICTRARKGNRFARFFQTIEMLATFGGCPWGRARRRKYGVKPNEPLPPENG
ncbi:MAG: hypothetical protein ABIP48_00510 [Planctomycetota bacterium]